MNRQQLVDERSRALHLKIAYKLRNHPEFWTIPEQNLRRWEEKMGGVPPAMYEWYRILRTASREEILSLLESPSEEAARLRSSSPFTGILSQDERAEIMKSFQG